MTLAEGAHERGAIVINELSLPEGDAAQKVRDFLASKQEEYRRRIAEERTLEKEANPRYSRKRELDSFYKYEIISRLLRDGRIHLTEVKEDIINMQKAHGDAFFAELFLNAAMVIDRYIKSPEEIAHK